MNRDKRKTFYEQLFSNRSGRKTFLVTLPFAFILLFLPGASIFATILFAGAVASRLNDLGRSRWHAAWLTLWMLLVVTMAQALPARGTSMAQHQAGLGLVELPLFILLLALGLWPGQKQANRFGPVPAGFRQVMTARKRLRQGSTRL